MNRPDQREAVKSIAIYGGKTLTRYKNGSVWVSYPNYMGTIIDKRCFVFRGRLAYYAYNSVKELSTEAIRALLPL